MKACSICGLKKAASDFARNAARKSGFQSFCRDCARAKWRRHSSSRPKGYRRGDYLEKTYGLTLEQYDQILNRQAGACAICKGPPRGQGSKLGHFDVDHDHTTGRVRGLLCNPCNQALGLLNDRKDVLVSAVQYLEASGC